MNFDAGFSDTYAALNDRDRRVLALSSGNATYVAKDPCKHGHDPVRYTMSNKCKVCHRLSMRKSDAPEEQDLTALYEDVDRVANAAKSIPETPEPKRGRTVREVARAFGCPTFHPIARCPHGHDSPRSTQYGYCVECHRLRSKVK